MALASVRWTRGMASSSSYHRTIVRVSLVGVIVLSWALTCLQVPALQCRYSALEAMVR